MKNAVEEIKNFASLVQGLQNDPDIAPLIDATKIVAIPRFSTALDAAISHYLDHGDHTLIVRMVMLVSIAKQQTAVLAYVCERTNLSHSWDNQELKFKRNKSLQNDARHRPLSEHLKTAGQRALKAVVSSASKPQGGAEKKPAKKRKYIDALDSWARLPGSFEGGRR